MNIIDRRLNPRGKNLPNRQRFIRRAKQQILESVREASSRESLREDGDSRVNIRGDALEEPQFRLSPRAGTRFHIAPGNKRYVAGDRIPREEEGRGGAGGAGESGGVESFEFALDRDEFVDLFLEDLELPHLMKKDFQTDDQEKLERAGYQRTGAAANLDLRLTMRLSLARRIALHRPKAKEIEALEAELARLEEAGDVRAAEVAAQLARVRARHDRIPFLDPLDLRYRRFAFVPKPATSAVMFCLMDVSGSMTAAMKDLAKQFYRLLYLFLKRRYRKVEIVFIRHTHVAREVDEETFFHSTESGGTIVSTALREMIRIMEERYPVRDWNIYAAQASDGDNMPVDNHQTVALLRDHILPLCQYYAYLEVRQEDDHLSGMSDLWRAYQRLAQDGYPIAMRRVSRRNQIYPVFRQLFSPKTETEVPA